ncbi:hypothetical protein HAX54_036091 [Datura stramonium]|uniref:Uncharacterized protein n=1 Tax=Datura stramonium TaxID=4076 RepID=A0ABS8VGB3_DATST|nr:hypothetical protein [Datura stramonium]
MASLSGKPSTEEVLFSSMFLKSCCRIGTSTFSEKGQCFAGLLIQVIRQFIHPSQPFTYNPLLHNQTMLLRNALFLTYGLALFRLKGTLYCYGFLPWMLEIAQIDLSTSTKCEKETRTNCNVGYARKYDQQQNQLA